MVNNNNNNMVVFLNLTCEMMIYAYVDDSPSVADLLWSKQQLNQGEFLKLTDEQEWSQLPTVDYSTHEPYFR
ncbi:hypothetical protein MUCCIDRAFT_115390 [Mucor lusitanicus CBS 277.49]|uniref:Uncharacterized protein n=1 Tax=Mucor lusitanicus CBS 277.49 TaxID=747725 RepID=A0A168H844_MUCCL|nr:hypothetical protein MUCCIDRAFT_115390 [Mucor lusitanicus CBS 277.49]